jgi:hypothetical protein
MDSLTNSPDQTLKVISTPERPDGPTIYSYRGGRITAWKSIYKLHLEGHPYDGCNFGSTLHAMRLIEWWLDRGSMPAPWRIQTPYVWPVPETKTQKTPPDP